MSMSYTTEKQYNTIAPSIASSRPRKVFRHRKTVHWTTPTEKYWLLQETPRDQKWARRIVLIGIAVGVTAMLAIVALTYLKSNRASYTLVLDDHFDTLDSINWIHEQQVGGYLDGSFDWTTDSPDNSWVADGMLHIRPTLTPSYENASIVNLTDTGQCTGSGTSQCVATQNVTAYQIIPPLQTARISSRKSITFGKVEVVAKFPKGDWMWPTISLEPDRLRYGQFPASGGIVLAQSHGNSPTFTSGGYNRIDTLVHFGADGLPYTDQVSLNRNSVKLGLRDFTDSFHKFGVEWTPTYIRTWLDYPSNTILKVTWPQGIWTKTNYGRYKNDYHWTKLTNPWTNGSLAAPYDVPFHLTLRNNVGAVSGIFADVPQKPWYDQAGRGASMIAFSQNRTWLSSWTQDTMQIMSVKMWQQNNVKLVP